MPNNAKTREDTAEMSFRRILKRYSADEKIAMLSVYDASMAQLCEDAGVDGMLVGDSMGHCIHGRHTTLSVRVEDICYHTSSVRRGAPRSWVIADVPFSHSDAGWDKLYDCATSLMSAGANMVKLEGGGWLVPNISRLVRAGIPVCCHIGLWPQKANTMGGYRIQGKDEASSQKIINDAKQLESAGASLIVVECVMSQVAARITEQLGVPTIGIGAGKSCSGQILVSYDALGLSMGHKAKFVRCFASKNHPTPSDAIKAYCEAVRDQSYPSSTESYQ